MDKKDGLKEKKALFLQRFVAFVVDMLIVSFAATLISTPFVDQEKLEKLEKQTIDMVEDFRDQEIGTKEYISQYTSLYYKTARTNGITTLITIF